MGIDEHKHKKTYCIKSDYGDNKPREKENLLLFFLTERPYSSNEQQSVKKRKDKEYGHKAFNWKITCLKKNGTFSYSESNKIIGDDKDIPQGMT